MVTIKKKVTPPSRSKKMEETRKPIQDTDPVLGIELEPEREPALEEDLPAPAPVPAPIPESTLRRVKNRRRLSWEGQMITLTPGAIIDVASYGPSGEATLAASGVELEKV